MTDSDLSHLLLWQSQAALYEDACFLSLKRIANYLTDRQNQAEMI